MSQFLSPFEIPAVKIDLDEAKHPRRLLIASLDAIATRSQRQDRATRPVLWSTDRVRETMAWSDVLTGEPHFVGSVAAWNRVVVFAPKTCAEHIWRSDLISTWDAWASYASTVRLMRWSVSCAGHSRSFGCARQFDLDASIEIYPREFFRRYSTTKWARWQILRESLPGCTIDPNAEVHTFTAMLEAGRIRQKDPFSLAAEEVTVLERREDKTLAARCFRIPREE